MEQTTIRIVNNQKVPVFKFGEGWFSRETLVHASLCIEDILNHHGIISLDYDDFMQLCEAGKGLLSAVAIVRGTVNELFDKAYKQLEGYDIEGCDAVLIYLWITKEQIQQTELLSRLRDFIDKEVNAVVKLGVTVTDKVTNDNAKLFIIGTGFVDIDEESMQKRTYDIDNDFYVDFISSSHKYSVNSISNVRVDIGNHWLL